MYDSAHLGSCRQHLGVDRVLAVPLTTALEYLSAAVYQVHTIGRHLVQTPGRRLEPDASAVRVTYRGVPPDQVVMTRFRKHAAGIADQAASMGGDDRPSYWIYCRELQ